MAEEDKNSLSRQGVHLIVRNATLADVPAIVDLPARVDTPLGMETFPRAAILGQINTSRQGEIVVMAGDALVGYCATFRISGDVALKPQTWSEVTGYGYGSRHDIRGDWPYGMEVCIDY